MTSSEQKWARTSWLPKGTWLEKLHKCGAVQNWLKPNYLALEISSNPDDEDFQHTIGSSVFLQSVYKRLLWYSLKIKELWKKITVHGNVMRWVMVFCFPKIFDLLWEKIVLVNLQILGLQPQISKVFLDH